MENESPFLKFKSIENKKATFDFFKCRITNKALTIMLKDHTLSAHFILFIMQLTNNLNSMFLITGIDGLFY